MTLRRAADALHITSEKLLLVEGLDDQRFFNAFARYLQIPNIQTETYGGRYNLRNILGLLVRNPQFGGVTALGIARDADSNRQSAFESVVSQLQRVGLPTPTAPMLPVADAGRSVSVLIIPPDSDAGALEDLCLSALMEDNPLLICADQYLECAATAGIESRQRAKSRLHAYLAAGKEPGRRLGEAADAGVWDWSSPAFGQVAGFLCNL